MSLRTVYVSVYSNLMAVAMLFAWGRHAGGAPVIFPATYTLIAAATVVAVIAVNRPAVRSFKTAFAALAISAVLHFALYIFNERAIAAGRVEPNLLGYLYAVTFTIAISSLGFLSKPEFQEHCGFARHAHLDEHRG